MKCIGALAALSLSMAIPMSASSARTFVSFSGLDTNPCSRTSPCRSFTAALAQTAAGGAIIALDSAGYGAVTIAQSVSLIAPEGVYAGIVAPAGGSGISINGATATDIVILRGLSIEGSGTAYYGIIVPIQPLLQLHVEHCTVTGFMFYGIEFQPNNSGSSLYVADTTVSDSHVAYHVFGNPGVNPHASIDHCRATGNDLAGYWVDQSSGAITNSVSAGNLTYGVFSQSSTSRVSVSFCQISNNGTGVFSQNSATIVVAHSLICDNQTGLSVSSGNLYSVVGDSTYGVKTNILFNNGTNGSFTNTVVAQ